MTDNASYQYTGEKRCGDRVWCHVWVTERLTPNKTGIEHLEWYWAFEINDEPLQKWIPMKFVFNERDKNEQVVNSVESSE
jgi:hypothetical protein